MAAKKQSKASSKPKARVAAKPKAGQSAAGGDRTQTARAKKSAKAAAKAKPKPTTKASSQPGEGSKVPRFTVPDATGKPVSSSELAGKPYILYFYPKDDTTGCTREACGFRDQYAKFSGAGVRIVGVSPDSEQSHQKFKSKYGLPFTLLADTERTLANAFGVWVKKKNYGREYMGIERSTFLVDGSGVIQRAWRGVRVDGHVDAVLDAARALE